MAANHDREREVFAEVSALEGAEVRAARLSQLCADDPALQQRVQALLDLGDPADHFFRPEDGPAQRLAPVPQPKTVLLSPDALREGVGTRIGHYRLLETIGEGGFGQVWRAEQVEPVRRQVALKILKAGMDTREVIGRFEAERQALALMDHPHVAHVFEAGSTPSGRPFFAMELVPGLPITEYCDQRRLSLRARVELFLPVCHAVQHAHQKGIIHRDLKPSNLLVAVQNERPHPMVIDFGIAKALQEPITDTPALTRIGQMIGTPAYMSPEQATRGSRDADTRSDIYSLGAVLYELLTGQPPLDPDRLREAGYAGIQRLLMEADPPPPSARVRSRSVEAVAAAAGRATTPRQWAAALQGDLDWVVMKALEKDRDRRYATANALARDLERYLREEPVTAGPPSAAYRLRKLAQRHRHAVVATAGILLALIGGLILAMAGFLQARQERNAARAAETQADAEAFRARQLAYASDMNLARHALENSNLGLARQLLERHRPDPGQIDLRHWEWRYLWQNCQSDAAFTLGTPGPAVTSLAYQPRSGALLAGAATGVVRLWDLGRREVATTLSDAGGIVAVSPRANLLATSNPQVGVFLWSLETLQELASLPDAGPMSGLAFSPQGDLLAGIAETGRLLVRHGGTWRPIAEVNLPPASGFHVGDLVFAADGSWIVHGGSDGRLRRFFSRTGELLADWSAHDEAITALALAPDSQRLASAAGFTSRTIKLWRALDGTLEAELAGHQAWVAAIAFSPDGTTLATAGADQTLRLWDLKSFQPVATLRGSLQEIWSMVWLNDGTHLITGGKDGLLQAWDLSKVSSAPDSTPLPGNQAAFLGAGNRLLALDAQGQVMEVMGTNARPVWTSLSSGQARLAVAPPTGWLAATDTNGIVRVAQTGPDSQATPTLTLHTNAAVSHLQFSADGRFLLEAADSRFVRIYSTDAWDAPVTWDSGEHLLGSVAFSPDNRLVASGGEVLVLLQRTNGQPLLEWAPHQQPTDAVAFSPDGRWLATASQEGVAKLWDTDTWREVAVFRGHLLGVHAVAFSPDGRRLATGSVGREAVKLWDLATRQEVLNLSWPGALVNQIAFSDDGSSLMAGADRLGVRLWHAPTAPVRSSALPKR